MSRRSEVASRAARGVPRCGCGHGAAPVCVRAPQHRASAVPGPRPPSSSSGRGRDRVSASHRSAEPRLGTGKGPGQLGCPRGPAQLVPRRPAELRAADGEPCPSRRQWARTGTPGAAGAARPGHPGPPRPERGRSPAPRGGVRCSPARNNRQPRPRPRPRPGRPNSAHRTTPRQISAGQVLRTLPVHRSDPRPVPPAYCRSPPVSHARCSLTRLHSPSLPVPRPAHRRSPCPVRQSRSPPPPVPGAPAPLTVPPRPFPVSRPHSPSLSAARPLLPEQKASSAPRPAPPSTGPALDPFLRYWLPRTPINRWPRQAPPPPVVFIRSPLAGARPPRPLPAGDWTAGRGGRGAAAAEHGRDHEGTTWVTSVGAARWGRDPPQGRPGGSGGPPGPCGHPRAMRAPPGSAGTPRGRSAGAVEAALGKGSGLLALLALRQPGPRRTGPAGCCRRVPGEAAVTQCPSHALDTS